MWLEFKDGNPYGNALYRRHYSARPYKDGRQPKLFCGPGEKIVLMTEDYSALFVWRKFKPLDNQKGINCAVFRNESEILSSKMILEAEKFAKKRWPKENRYYTYVNSKKIRSDNPGCCFKKAGWTFCGITKSRKLLIFEKVLK